MARTPMSTTAPVPGNGTSRMAIAGAGPVPSRARSRNRARITGGVLLLAVSALAAVVIYGDLGDRRAVLAVARPVAAGSVVEDGDLTEVRVAADRGVSTVPASERRNIVGRTAKVALVPASLLAKGQTGRGAGLPPGTTLVGATLKPGQFPVGLRPGDRILVVVMPAQQDASALDSGPTASGPVKASLVAVEAVRDSGGTISVSLAVPAGAAPDMATAGAGGRLVLLVEAS